MPKQLNSLSFDKRKLWLDKIRLIEVVEKLALKKEELEEELERKNNHCVNHNIWYKILMNYIRINIV